MSSRRIALLAVLLVFGCDSTDPSDSSIRPSFLTIDGCKETPGCDTGGPPLYNSIQDYNWQNVANDYYFGDPNPSSPGIYLSYWDGDCMATKYYVATGHSDFDSDGLDDNCEYALAHAFRPMIRFSINESCPLGEPYWAAKFFNNSIYGTGDFVRIAYLPAFYDDCGELGHKGDSEFIQLTVAFNGLTKHWVLINSWISAHAVIGRPFGNSVLGPLGSNSSTSGPDFEWPSTKSASYPRIWVSSDKHAFYRTKSACDHGAVLFGAFENCDQPSYGAHDTGRFQVFRDRNIGNGHKILKDCVKSTNIVGGNIECLWTGTKFTGWQVNPPTSAPPYLPFLNSIVYGCYMITVGQCIASSWGM